MSVFFLCKTPERHNRLVSMHILNSASALVTFIYNLCFSNFELYILCLDICFGSFDLLPTNPRSYPKPCYNEGWPPLKGSIPLKVSSTYHKPSTVKVLDWISKLCPVALGLSAENWLPCITFLSFREVEQTQVLQPSAMQQSPASLEMIYLCSCLKLYHRRLLFISQIVSF